MNKDVECVHGLNPVFEVMRAGRRQVREVLVNQVQRDVSRVQKLVRLAERNTVPVIFTDKQELFEACGTREHQGVVARCDPYPYVHLKDVNDTVSRWLVVDNVEDPHNLGAILRSAEIFGFHDVFVPHRGSPGIYASVLKASAGAAEHLRICKDAQSNRYVRRAQEAGYQVYALEGKGTVSLLELPVPLPDKICLVIGGEDRSVGQFILNLADAVVRIPQQGQINSLNASVAAGIAMFQLQGVGG